mmetsp:Transcript_31778/g.75472  ORF Transcript_31778/g.75472 Transcript_31778/m.75472 type:complete len:317 (-) Transcript_31778:483-1433(-)
MVAKNLAFSGVGNACVGKGANQKEKTLGNCPCQLPRRQNQSQESPIPHYCANAMPIRPTAELLISSLPPEIKGQRMSWLLLSRRPPSPACGVMLSCHTQQTPKADIRPNRHSSPLETSRISNTNRVAFVSAAVAGEHRTTSAISPTASSYFEFTATGERPSVCWIEDRVFSLEGDGRCTGAGNRSTWRDSARLTLSLSFGEAPRWIQMCLRPPGSCRLTPAPIILGSVSPGPCTPTIVSTSCLRRHPRSLWDIPRRTARLASPLHRLLQTVSASLGSQLGRVARLGVHLGLPRRSDRPVVLECRSRATPWNRSSRT